MSESTTVRTEINQKTINTEEAEMNNSKRAASSEIEDGRETKTIKLEKIESTTSTDETINSDAQSETTVITSNTDTDSVTITHPILNTATSNTTTTTLEAPDTIMNDIKPKNRTMATADDNMNSPANLPGSPDSDKQSNDNVTPSEPNYSENKNDGNKEKGQEKEEEERSQQSQNSQQMKSNENEGTQTNTENDRNPIPTNNNNNNQSQVNTTHILSIAQGAHPPPPGLHLLTDPQQQQLLQSYVQAQGQDLSNLTASSLAQAMVSPIPVPSLASNFFQQFQQSGNVITALPGPPPQMSHPAPTALQPNNGAPAAVAVAAAPNGPLTEEGAKRPNTRSLSNDERRQRRLLRNRVAAKECRKKKKQHIQDMEEKIVRLEEENAKLVKEVEELKEKLSSLNSMQGSESYRLMKEVEELNAKLGMGGPLPSSHVLPVLTGQSTDDNKQIQQHSVDTPSTNNHSLSSSSPHENNKEMAEAIKERERMKVNETTATIETINNSNDTDTTMNKAPIVNDDNYSNKDENIVSLKSTSTTLLPNPPEIEARQQQSNSIINNNLETNTTTPTTVAAATIASSTTTNF
ncbi:uncharacterized protein BX663DRAFT_493648 [Cokeromyces recurvatus]|uniref:uncharacterized protein n=1 Tax=Cokeromyces recurvatus TaxID=90255 RepID=UPI00221EBC0A|nr:uncharacterized protein BX663DRAFT_493648 [Cokeromyces recurvatus]KAI7908279.1 hypothetical protein BX663DRAFT_493648 [Cokeromyces recurvatus]